MMKYLVMSLLCAASIFSGGCADDGGGGGTDEDTDTGTGTGLGTVEVIGNFDGALPEGSGLRVSLFECPFQMPPDYFFEGTWDATSGDVHAEQESVTPGEWCLMAYIDGDPDDGLAPVIGVDALNATGEENAQGALAIDVIADETTTVDLSFAI